MNPPNPTNVSRPWRRDAWRWALKYGVLALAIAFISQRNRIQDPALTWRDGLLQDLAISVGIGIFCALAVLVWRFRGSLVDLDELQSVGRGGLGLPREGLRKTPSPPEGPEEKPPASSARGKLRS